MKELISSIDIQLFNLINQSLSNALFDMVCPLLRNKLTWIPLYTFLAIYFYKRHQLKIIYILLGTLLTVILTDQISSSIIKPYFHRIRPCNDLSIQARLLLSHCGSGFSFVSSHAANHFGFAFIVSPFFEKKNRALSLFLIWASIVSLSQVYVGVHYPFDIFGGAVLGSVVGYLISFYINKIFFKSEKELQHGIF